MPDARRARSVASMDVTDPSGSYLTPSFDHARVADAMRPRVLTCDPETPLVNVAQRMASEHVHAIVVLLETVDPDGEISRRPWAVVTDHDILRSAAFIATGLLATSRGEVCSPTARPLPTSGRMLEHHEPRGVVKPRMGRPVGVLSTLDIAGILGWGLG